MKIEVATKKYFKEKKFIEETIDFPENIQELLDQAADLYPTALAINFFEQEPQAKSISYADLRVSVYKLADGFQQKGIKKGIINLGGKAQYIYDFAFNENKNVKKVYLKKNNKIGMPFDSSLNLKKLKKILKK